MFLFIRQLPHVVCWYSLAHSMEISNNENWKTVGTFSFLSGESGASPSQFRDGGSIGQLLQWDATAKQLPEFSMVQVKLRCSMKQTSRLFNVLRWCSAHSTSEYMVIQHDTVIKVYANVLHYVHPFQCMLLPLFPPISNCPICWNVFMISHPRCTRDIPG